MSKPATLQARLRKHPLIDLLFTLKGNPRTCVFIEPLWGIPNSLIAPFTAVYMRSMGISDLRIGFALSAALVAQVFCAFFGGIIADKLGRKTTTNLGDFLGWVVPCAIWACAQNYWFFLIAMVLNSFEQVNQTAWVCLLVEDAPPKDILNMWNWVTIAGLLAAFFAPISGVLVDRFSVVPVMRVLYGIFSASMLLKCYITIRYTTETRQGKIRKAETRGVSVSAMARGYLKLLPGIFRNSGTLRVLVVMIVLHITGMVNGNFYGLYATGALGLPENFLAYFPIIRAVVMLLFFFVVGPRLDRFRVKVPMSGGLLLYMGGMLVLIFSPKHTVVPLILYTLLEAVAFGLVYPRKELMTAVFVDRRERARIVALLTTLMLTFSAPFGSIAGALSKADGRLPFVLSLVLFLTAFCVIITMKQNPGAAEEAEAEAEASPSEALEG